MGESIPGECLHAGLQGAGNSLVQYKIQTLKYFYTLTVETVTYLMAFHGFSPLRSAIAAL